jgi:hypothetical protein
MRVRAACGAALVAGLWLAAASVAVQAEEAEAATSIPVLVFDPVAMAFDTPAHALRVPRLSQPDSLSVSRVDNPDGSSLVAVKRSLPGAWGTNVGMDLGMPAPRPASYEPGDLLPGGEAAKPARAAWASLGVVPDFATLDARVDPGNDQGRVGTTLQHSLPIGGRFAVTLHDSYGVTGSFATIAPLTAAEVAPVWSNESGVTLNVLPTGTTFTAAVASVSTDPAMHHSLTADQRIYGPLHVTTSITDPGQADSNKSISAGLKLNW